jgi:hypothetical protein
MDCASAGCTADLNGNGTIEVSDLLILLGEFGCTSDCTADITGDGMVTVLDLLQLVAEHGNNCP